MGGFSWVTLATNDSYSLGALVLAHSLRQVNTIHKLSVLITPAVSAAMRSQLESIFDLVKIVDVLDSKDEANLALLKRPELGITFTKLHCWQLTQFEKGVFLDADTLVVRNCDELFEREEFSAAPDVGWPDCFNSGVFVFRPSNETFTNLVQFAIEKGSFDGGDQGVLNQFFNTWATDDIGKHLPFVYNLTSVAVYSYIPAFKQYGAESRIVHFIGPVKPWLQAVDPATRTVTPSADSGHLQPLLQQWWDIFIEKVHPGLSSDLECAIGMFPFFAQPACSQDPLDCSLARSDPFPPPPPPPPEAHDFPDPYTPYIEKDDERQYNLPYQPFQVVSSEGELLNITFADYARETEPHEVVEETFPIAPASEEPPPAEEQHQQFECEERVEERQFDYHQFVPDELCINAYLEHNVQEYQPYELHPKEQVFEPLPRFLTIPEDDWRQSQKPYEPEVYWHEHHQEETQPPWEEPHHVHDRPPSPVPERHEPPPITKSKSMSNLLVDVTDTQSFQNLTSWKSQPDVTPAESAKKLPGLKPLVPKVVSPGKFSAPPKYTEFTEVNMVTDYTDPFGPPVDNVGFVERAIMSKTKTARIHRDVAPAPPLPPPLPVFTAIPEINQYVDLSDCKRQAGNVEDAVPTTSGGVKTFVPKISPRRVKRSTRRAAEKWKPPETTSFMYDVDSIIKRLSEFSIGYTPPKTPDAPNTLAVAVEPEMETPADRLFRGSGLEKNLKEVPLRASVATAKKPLSNFGPLVHSSPFAAPSGESLSELDQSVPEIVVCVASPDAQNVSSPNGLNETFTVASCTGTEDESFLTPIGRPVNGTRNSSSEEDSFVSALSSQSVKSNDVKEVTKQMKKLKIQDESSLGSLQEDFGIFDVKDWEELLDTTLTAEEKVPDVEKIIEDLAKNSEIEVEEILNKESNKSDRCDQEIPVPEVAEKITSSVAEVPQTTFLLTDAVDSVEKIEVPAVVETAGTPVINLQHSNEKTIEKFEETDLPGIVASDAQENTHFEFSGVNDCEKILEDSAIQDKIDIPVFVASEKFNIEFPGDETLENLSISIAEEAFESPERNILETTPRQQTQPSSEANESYATILKKTSSNLPPKPAELPVRILPEPSPKPQQQNGLKRARKAKKVKPVVEETVVVSSPVKFNKRKIEKPEVEFPINRFELLPEETQKLTHPKKKVKKCKKFSKPSSSFPPSLSPSSSVRLDDEEEATPRLPEPDDNPGIAGAIAQLNLDPKTTETDAGNTAAQAEYLRRQSWETGQVDYMGRDSFANVWSKISETLSQNPLPENPPSPAAPSKKE